MRELTRRGALAAAVVLALSAPAHATPPAQALYGFINNQSTAIYAGNSPLGVCIQIETQTSPGIWIAVSTIECGITPAKLTQYGGAHGYIEYLRPDINNILNSYFNGGTGVEADLDEAFNTFYKFNGPQLVPK